MLLHASGGYGSNFLDVTQLVQRYLKDAGIEAELKLEAPGVWRVSGPDHVRIVHIICSYKSPRASRSPFDKSGAGGDVVSHCKRRNTNVVWLDLATTAVGKYEGLAMESGRTMPLISCWTIPLPPSCGWTVTGRAGLRPTLPVFRTFEPTENVLPGDAAAPFAISRANGVIRVLAREDFRNHAPSLRMFRLSAIRICPR
jgi:hypothetical protein